MQISKKAAELRKKINEHNIHYYVYDSPIISDSEYDKLLNELQNKKNFINILKNTSEGAGVHVFIGSNTQMFNLSGCSMIVAPLKQRIKNKNVSTLGAIGVIGPSRLNYSRIIPMVDFTAKVLNKFLN